MIELVRTSRTPLATTGVLQVNGVSRFVTMENPWMFNRPNISCIPSGNYHCTLEPAASFPSTSATFSSIKSFIQVHRVPGRSGILFHPGNTAEDTEGCILLGMGFAVGFGVPKIVNSKQATELFREFVETALKGEFDLVVREA